MLFPRSVQTELRQMFTLLGDRVAKHVGVDLARVRRRPWRSAAREGLARSRAHAQDVATGLGFGEIDVYVSARQPYAMVAEPTSPVSLVHRPGDRAAGDPRGDPVRRGLRAQARAGLARDPGAPRARRSRRARRRAACACSSRTSRRAGLDADAIAAQTQKLTPPDPDRPVERAASRSRSPSTPSSSATPTSPRDLRVAGLRAGLVASGSLVAGLTHPRGRRRAPTSRASWRSSSPGSDHLGASRRPRQRHALTR